MQGKLRHISGMRVLIIGDSMIDSYIWGRVERISPEAPVPVVSIIKREHRPGGAANVALNVKALGAIPFLCTVAGDDYHGEIFAGLLKNQGISSKGLMIEPGRITTVKTRVISANHHLLRIDDEQTTAVNSSTTKRMLTYCLSLITKKQTDVIIFEDYNKGVITPGMINSIITAARKNRIPVTVDPKKQNFFAYRGATMFKPNFREFTEGLKQDIDKHDVKKMAALATGFLKKQSISVLLLTLADAGIFISDGTKHYQIKASDKLDIADVSGAGDTVIAVGSLLLAAGVPLQDIAFIANLAGGLVCEKPGVVPVTREQLAEALVMVNHKL